MHWCANETMALMAMIPIVGYVFRKIQLWYHDKFHEKHPCPCDTCDKCEEEDASFSWNK